MQSVLHEVEELESQFEASNNSVPINDNSHRNYEIPIDFQIEEEGKEEEKEEKPQDKLLKPVDSAEATTDQSLLSKVNLSHQTHNFLKANNLLSKLTN